MSLARCGNAAQSRVGAAVRLRKRSASSASVAFGREHRRGESGDQVHLALERSRGPSRTRGCARPTASLLRAGRRRSSASGRPSRIESSRITDAWSSFESCVDTTSWKSGNACSATKQRHDRLLGVVEAEQPPEQIDVAEERQVRRQRLPPRLRQGLRKPAREGGVRDAARPGLAQELGDAFVFVVAPFAARCEAGALPGRRRSGRRREHGRAARAGTTPAPAPSPAARSRSAAGRGRPDRRCCRARWRRSWCRGRRGSCPWRGPCEGGFEDPVWSGYATAYVAAICRCGTGCHTGESPIDRCDAPARSPADARGRCCAGHRSGVPLDSLRIAGVERRGSCVANAPRCRR